VSYAECVTPVLQRGLVDTNDFVSLVTAGERLRRAVVLADDKASFEDLSVLADYDGALVKHAALAPAGLAADLEAALVDLLVYSTEPVWKRAAQRAEAESILCDIDEVLCVAVACHRVGCLTARELADLRTTARDGVGDLVPKLQDLWQFAEDWELTHGPDPDFPNVYHFWEELARFAPTRIELAVALQHRSRRSC
jgi:hypothetical protein